MNISGYDSTSISTLFSSLSTSSSSSSSSNSGIYGVNLVDYATIRSGNYYKLMKAYYSTVDTSDSSSSSTSTSTSKDTAKQLAAMEESADDMTDAAADLLKKGTSSVFSKKTTTDEDGKATSAYDTDAIYKKVNSFVDAYNSLLSASSSSNNSGISTASAALVNMTKANEGLLSSVGITMDSDKLTLSIDEDKFKNSDMSTVKSLFNGAGSYAYQVSSRASMIKYYAETEASKANTYSSSGLYTYNYATGEIYNTSV